MALVWLDVQLQVDHGRPCGVRWLDDNVTQHQNARIRFPLMVPQALAPFQNPSLGALLPHLVNVLRNNSSAWEGFGWSAKPFPTPNESTKWDDRMVDSPHAQALHRPASGARGALDRASRPGSVVLGDLSKRLCWFRSTCSPALYRSNCCSPANCSAA